MKTLVFGALIAIAALVGFLYLARGRHNFDEPSYQITMKEENIEIREYDGYTVAEITISATFDRATSQSFRPLFGYISGDNLARADLEMTAPVLVEPTSEKIAMTVPVLVEPTAVPQGDPQTLIEGSVETWTTAFILPEPYTSNTAPIPDDSRITIRDIPSHQVASIRFNGSFTNRAVEKHRQMLEHWLADQGLPHLSDWRAAAYDPPMTPPSFRRNEVLVTLKST